MVYVEKPPLPERTFMSRLEDEWNFLADQKAEEARSPPAKEQENLEAFELFVDREKERIASTDQAERNVRRGAIILGKSTFSTFVAGLDLASDSSPTTSKIRMEPAEFLECWRKARSDDWENVSDDEEQETHVRPFVSCNYLTPDGVLILSSCSGKQPECQKCSDAAAANEREVKSAAIETAHSDDWTDVSNGISDTYETLETPDMTSDDQSESLRRYSMSMDENLFAPDFNLTPESMPKTSLRAAKETKFHENFETDNVYREAESAHVESTNLDDWTDVSDDTSKSDCEVSASGKLDGRSSGHQDWDERHPDFQKHASDLMTEIFGYLPGALESDPVLVRFALLRLKLRLFQLKLKIRPEKASGDSSNNDHGRKEKVKDPAINCEPEKKDQEPAAVDYNRQAKSISKSKPVFRSQGISRDFFKRVFAKDNQEHLLAMAEERLRQRNMSQNSRYL